MGRRQHKGRHGLSEALDAAGLQVDAAVTGRTVAGRDELAETLSALIRDVERFDHVLRQERRRLVTLSSGQTGLGPRKRLRSRRLQACVAQFAATVDAIVVAIHGASGPA